jgi:hypothetical protein
MSGRLAVRANAAPGSGRKKMDRDVAGRLLRAGGMMNISRLLSLVVLGAAWPVSMAIAEPAPAVEGAAGPELPIASITFSPAHLAISTLEVTGEVRLAPTLSAAVVGGLGRFGSIDPFEEGGSTTVVELGAQFRWYALGDFRRGLQLGAEVLYVVLSSESSSRRLLGEGLGVGPFVGYKHVFGLGLTLDGQVGAQAIALRAGDGDSSSQARTVGVLLNLNAGWSF